MRVLILLGLIGGLAWYGWTAYGSVEGADVATVDDTEQPANDGAMIPMGPRPGANPARQEEPAAIELPPPPVREEAQPSAKPLTQRNADGGLQLDLGTGRGDLTEQGRRMLHDLGGVQDLLTEESSLSADRKQLLFALASVVLGNSDAVRAATDELANSREVTSEELAFLRSALGNRPRARAAAAGLRGNALLLGTRLGVLQREADEARFAENHRAAAEAYSEVIREELRAPWAADSAAIAAWAEHLNAAQAQHRWNRRGEWPSFEVVVQPGDSLTRIRKRIIRDHPEMVICTGLIAAVNQTSEYLQPEQVLRIPSEPVRAEVYIGARWVLYLHGEEVLAAWPCAVGREGHETPPGKFRAGVKQENPPWMREGHAIVPFGDPENPLGTRWISWDGRKGYGFHGTWKPETVGKAASDGCIRLRNEDVETLFEILPQGSEIDVRP